MNILQTCVGMNDGPTAGQTQFQNELFKNSVVQFLIVNNDLENRIEPTPDFTHDPLMGIVKRTNIWVQNDKAIFVITNCNCK